MSQNKRRKPWTWVPSLYFAEGLPYVAVMTVSLIMYKRLGMSNTDIAFYTGWLNLPWVIKPFWSPFVELFKTKRWWIVNMQLLMGAGLAGIAFFIPTSFYAQATLAFFWLVAFNSATHDIAADGFYLIELNPKEQSFFVGIRNLSYRLAVIFGQGTLVYLAGILEKSTGNIPFAWSVIFYILAGIVFALFLYHKFILPNPETDASNPKEIIDHPTENFWWTFKTFFKKPHIVSALFFILSYRFAEAQLLKLIQPFLLDSRDVGGLGLDTEQVGIIYGLGVAGLMVGGILGGIVASKGGLKKWLWPMTLSMLLTCITFVYLAYTQPTHWIIINVCVLIEQFGYGFGFTAFALFLMYYSKGEHKAVHYAIATGLSALGMMLPGMIAGWIQEKLGYQHFFLWVMVCSIIPILATALLKIDAEDDKTASR